MFTDLTDVCYASEWVGAPLGIRVIRDISGSIKINCDARRVITIIFLKLRFLLIELIFATHRGGAERVSRGQGGDSGDGWGGGLGV